MLKGLSVEVATCDVNLALPLPLSFSTRLLACLLRVVEEKAEFAMLVMLSQNPAVGALAGLRAPVEQAVIGIRGGRPCWKLFTMF